jgi:DNA polymerase delta subunit 3
MLFEFHQKQNAKRPGSVHATYLVTGNRTPPKPQPSNNAEPQDSEDAVMQSSPPIPNNSVPQAPESDAEPTPIRSILLVKEEHLQQAKATFENITGIHIYSLASGGLSDLNSLTECNRKIAVDYASEDPLVVWKQYGTIQNPNVRRRTQKRPPPDAPAPAVKQPVSKAKPVPVLEKQASKVSNESGPNSAKATPVPEKAADATKKKTATKPATVKRQPSDIFKSFAKGANKAKKVASTESSAAPSPAPTTSAKEDDSMGGMSDDDPDNPAEDEEIEVDAGSGKSKKDREADLKAMMDFDDEPMEDVEEEATQGAIDTPKESEAEDSQGTKQEEPQETMTVENGRRRGRRRVMKKKTVKDDEGYLGELFFIAMTSQMALIYYSDERGSSMGVLLRRRTRAKESQTYASPSHQRCKERCCQTWTRQHHVLLREEMIECTRSRRENIVV